MQIKSSPQPQHTTQYLALGASWMIMGSSFSSDTMTATCCECCRKKKRKDSSNSLGWIPQKKKKKKKKSHSFTFQRRTLRVLMKLSLAITSNFLTSSPWTLTAPWSPYSPEMPALRTAEEITLQANWTLIISCTIYHYKGVEQAAREWFFSSFSRHKNRSFSPT